MQDRKPTYHKISEWWRADRHSIRSKLLVLVYVTVVVLSLGLGLLAYHTARSIVIENISEHELRFVQEISNLIDQEIVSLRSQVESLAFDQGLNDLLRMNLLNSIDMRKYMVDDQIQRLVYLTNARKDAILSLVVLDIDGGILQYKGDENFTFRSDLEKIITQSTWFTSFIGSETRWLWLGFGDPGLYTRGFAEKNGLSMVHSVMDLRKYPNYSMVGMIHVVLNINNLVNTARRVIDSYEKLLYIIDEAGRIVLSFDDDELGAPFAVLENANDLYTPGVTKTKVTVFDGADVLSIQVHDTRYGWDYVQLVPLEVVQQSLRPTVILIVSIVGLTLLVAYVVIRLEVGRTLFPLKQLQDTMGSIGDGQVAARFEYHAADEIGMLGQSFNLMMAKLATLEKEKQRKEFEALQAQINPHFLYNTLNTIRMMAIRQQVPDIRYAISSLIHLFRNTIGKGDPFSTVAEEITTIQHYVNLMQLRYGKEFMVEFSVDQRVKDCSVLRFLLQPIVENAIFHGVSQLAKVMGLIKVEVVQEADMLVFRVRDNGPGIPEDTLASILEDSFQNGREHQPGTIGIPNVHRRIVLYHGDRYGLQVVNISTGAEVTIRLPLQTKEDTDEEHLASG